MKKSVLMEKKRIDGQEEILILEESTITPNIIGLGSHDIPTLNGGFVAGE